MSWIGGIDKVSRERRGIKDLVNGWDKGVGFGIYLLNI